MPNTLYDKIWKEHLVDQQDDGTALLFVDRHLVHEVTSPQAFEGLRNSKRKVRHPKLTLAVADHNVPTTDRTNGISDKESKIQVDTLEKNCKEFDIQLFGMEDRRQGIVHIIGPEQGFTQPGTVIVCGDSHTATHGAFGALAFGIGTSEVEHVLATQTLVQKKAKNFRINVNGKLPLGVTSKDVILQIIGKIGTAGGTGCVIEYAGRLQNKKNLMEEYKKIANVTKKIDQDAPHNIILVLDATSGQNVINQVEEFNKIIPLTGLIMTKLDGTAKGGILLAIAKKYQLPIIALGLGEKEDDLQLFNAEKFAEAFTQVN